MAEEAAPVHIKRQSRKAGRSQLRKLISRNLQHFCLRLGHALLSPLPLPLGRGLGWVGGTLGYWALGHERKIALANLSRVFGGERTPREIRRLARAVFRHAATVALEWIILRRWPLERLRASFPEVEAGLAKFERDVKATGLGVVGLTAHFGNWEVLALFYSRFTPGLLAPVAKRAKLERTQEFLHRLRSGEGVDVVYTDESPRKLLRAISAGKLLAFLPDQDLRTNSGIFVDFFGKPAYTVILPVRLARRTGAKMVLCLLLREGKGFRLVVDGPFDIPRSPDEEADIASGTQHWSHLLEAQIRRCPEQWVWFYPRWRTPLERPRRHFRRRKKRSSEPVEVVKPLDSREPPP
jgi:KDO2-lipid IV(A) lauroyltransferase